jgi:hypothetical protein
MNLDSSHVLLTIGNFAGARIRLSSDRPRVGEPPLERASWRVLLDMNRTLYQTTGRTVVFR